QHRLLAGTDVLSDLAIDREALRRQCEKEARGKLLRLRALYLGTGGASSALERLMLESLKSILIFLRHLLRLQGTDPGPRYRDALVAGERVLGSFPLMSRLLDHREGITRLVPRGGRLAFRDSRGEGGRLVNALDTLDV